MLTLGGHPVSLGLLEEVKLEIAATDRDGIANTLTVSELAPSEDEDLACGFRVPEGLRYLQFTLRARVKSLSLGRHVELSDDKSFEVNQVDTTASVHDIFLSRGGAEYVLDVLGKNGEPGPDIPIHLTFKHRAFRDTVFVTLKSDSGGRLRLSRLKGIEWFEARLADDLSRRWHPEADRVDLPGEVHAGANHPFRVAVAGNGRVTSRPDHTLLALRGDTYVDDRTDAVQLRDGFLEIGGLPPGNYELLLKTRGARIPVRVTNGEATAGCLVSETRMLEESDPAPLQIVSAKADDRKVDVRLANASAYTRVHAVATRYVPPFDPFDDWSAAARLPLARHGAIKPPHALYIAMRDIGDEYRYVLERRYAQRFPGNMLDRPELLLNPWRTRKTETGVQEAGEGEAPDRLAEEAAAMASSALAPEESVTADASVWSFDFLKTEAVVLANLKPDADGRVVIDREKLGANQQLRLMAVDPTHTVCRRVGLGESGLERRDLRMARTLDADTHFNEQKKISVVRTGERFELADTASSAFEVYDTLAKAYQLLATLSGDPTLARFGFILDWPAMSESDKQRQYGKYACHELNFFLFHKDKPFFESVVRPYIAHKKDKTFMDHWLLEDDLSAYEKEWAFQRLNIVEKILLLGRGTGAGPYVNRLFELLPPDPYTRDRLFDAALKGRAFEAPQFQGVADAAMTADDMGLEAMAPEAEAPAALSAGQPMVMEKAAEMARSESPRRSKKRMARREVEVAKREEVRRFFQKLDKTDEWAENNYYHLPIERQVADLVRVNAFWNDYAASDAGQPFLSPHFAHATGTFAEMMLALAVLDLPFAAGAHATEVREAAFRLTAAGPLVVFHREIQPADDADEAVPVMLGQNFFRADDRYQFADNEQVDKFVTGEVLFRTVYGCQVVLGNPTASPRELTLMLQLPRGAMPLKNGFYSKSQPVRMEAYGTWTLEYYFYFPEAGAFGIYPAQVAKNEGFVAGAAGQTFTVVEQFSEVDRASWAYLSQNGGDDQVLDFLREHNPHRLPLDKIAFRMRDKAFFKQCIALLRSLHVYDDTLWSYGLHHDVPDVIGEYLKHTFYADRCGMAIASPLLALDPVARMAYQHLEYRPLVNARAHRLGGERTILNDRFQEQYEGFLRKLTYQPAVGDADRLTVACYLLLQDRVDEALAFFRRVDPEALPTRLQYDYLQVYLDFYEEKIDHARKVAERYARFPVPRWRKLFANALAQLDELDGQSAGPADERDRERMHQALADTAPFLDFSIESGRVTVNYRNLKHCTVNYYPMEIELLFSRNPFLKAQGKEFALIRPGDTERVALPEGQSHHHFDLPEKIPPQQPDGGDRRPGRQPIPGLLRSFAGGAHDGKLRPPAGDACKRRNAPCQNLRQGLCTHERR